jgi:HK97 family phage prohead protease
MVMMSKETRVVATQPVHELRMVDDEGSGATMLVGYGAVFGKRSQDLGGFTEIIEPAAFNRSLSEGGDVLCCVNHDVNLLLGRSASDTLRLSVDDVGLRYEIDMPDTSAGRDAMVLAERGDLFGSSFTFSVAPSGERWSEDDEGRKTRFLSEVRLYELGPVVSPAYLDTTTGVRSMDKFVNEAAAVAAESTPDDADKGTSREDAAPVARRPTVRK